METKLCLDVGGTEIKAAVVQENGTLLGEIRYFPANSRESAPVLLDHFAEILQLLARDCEAVTGIRMAFPGPFDYEKGISLMQGLDKYDSLYGLELRKELMQRLNLSGIKEEDILFINDVSAFCSGGNAFRQSRRGGKIHVYLHRNRMRQRVWFGRKADGRAHTRSAQGRLCVSHSIFGQLY